MSDRLTLLVTQTPTAQVTGIDFIKVVDPDVQTILDVYFIVEPDVLDTPMFAVLGETFPVANLRIWAPSGGRTVFEPKITNATWQNGEDARKILKITVEQPGDHSLYRLHIADSRVDYHFNNVEFSFKQGCPSTLDCKQVPVDESCPEDEDDIPLDHTARDFLSIRRDLLDYAEQKFPEWTHHSDADVGVMMIEVMAALGDELSYVQDRFVREGKLGELSQRRSLRQLVRLLDYEIHDGLSPRTLLELRVDEGYDVNNGGDYVLAGTPAWAHRLGEPPIRFEVGEGLADLHANDGDPVEFWVHKNWQGLAVYEPDEAKPKLAKGATEMFLVGHVPADAGETPVEPLYEGTGAEYWEETDRMLVLTEDPGDGSPPKRHLVRVKSVELTTDPLNGDALITRIEWDEAYALPCPMLIANLTVSANIVPATAGETFTDFFWVRGNDEEYPDMVEREGPLDSTTNTRSPVYRCSPTKCETLGLGWLGELRSSIPEIEVQEVDPEGNLLLWDTDKRWEWRRTLLDSVRDDRHFTIEDGTWRRIRGFRTPDGGELVHRDWASNAGYTVRFGDGEFGQVPADETLFRVRYRTGPGSAANVNADTIVLLDDPVTGAAGPVLLSAVTNPFDVTTGLDPETLQRAKFLAPEAFRHDLPRAVRPDDYARLAESLSWVQKANATFRWTGSWLTVFVAVDPKGAYSLTASQREELEDLLDGVRQVGRDVVVLEPDYLDLDLVVRVCAKPGYYTGHVEAAILEALTGVGGFFDPDNFTFGMPLRRTRLEAAIQAVEGVSAVRAISMRVRDLTESEMFEKAVLQVGPGQIVRVANDRRHPERGTLRVGVTEVVG